MAIYFNLYTLKKTLKRREQQKKNRYHQMMFQLARMRRADEARKRHNEKLMAPKRQQQAPKEWSDKVSKVRNRLTGRKRDAKERWNRFAGTGDAGGRGL
ncbi:MAG: hypothetical protein EBX37_18710 [Alphaproteobacteria bacterium]|nr:hypothetical protein [Alphaproteobacteria bacterium]